MRPAALPALLHQDAAAPLFWPPSRLGAGSAWYGHVPFAHWLIGAIRPRLVVELGTHNGVSFAAFCESALRHDLPTQCIAVDLWQGDAHAGFYPDKVHDDLAAFLARHYPHAQMRRMTFADALPGIADGTSDLLHVDGRHRYEDVREDYESWRPKLSPGAVVLFHDICETRGDFGVHRYWAELAAQAPHFAFHHAHGLGVLLPGPTPPPALLELCALQHDDAASSIRARFQFCGDRWVAHMQALRHEAGQQRLRAHAARLQAHIDRLGTYVAALEAASRPDPAPCPAPDPGIAPPLPGRLQH